MTMEAWFDSLGWAAQDFQSEAWAHFRAGRSCLVRVPTGAGKTYAGIGGLLDALEQQQTAGVGLRCLYVTPLRAMTRDLELATRRACEGLGLAATVDTRTGDTTSSARARQRRKLPTILFTTPESLALMLTWNDAGGAFAGLQQIVVDEWHELLASKRGVLTQLLLSRLRAIAPQAVTTGLTATISAPEVAAQALGAVDEEVPVVSSTLERPVHIEQVLPAELDGFPWAGHAALKQVSRVLPRLQAAQQSIVFCNVRSHAERWFAAVAEAWPEVVDGLALHHGSLDAGERARVEGGLKDGSLRCVVSTSSLDLGVDFGAVDLVVQIGSPRGLARLLQRAGRSAHRPGEPCRLVCVPTHALEIAELSAARAAITAGEVEAPRTPHAPLDVLAQHAATMSIPGIAVEQLYAEVRRSDAYRDLDRSAFDAVLQVITQGGARLERYPQFKRVELAGGRLRIASRRHATAQRMNVGTITAEPHIAVQVIRGKRLGEVEESFAASLRTGDVFRFAGRTLRMERLRDNLLEVRSSNETPRHVPRWMGGRLPLSAPLANWLRHLLGAVDQQSIPAPERALIAGLLRTQSRRSHVPGPAECLVETATTRDGHHCFLYAFAGRTVHESLAALIAVRLSRRQRGTFTLSVNDYGIELLSPQPYPFHEILDNGCFAEEAVTADLAEAVNLSELARRRFRDCAAIAGLTQTNLPGLVKGVKHVQASAGLLYDVLVQFDPDHVLLAQARREALEEACDLQRLHTALDRLRRSRLVPVVCQRLSPFAFPLLLERREARVSNEDPAERIERLLAQVRR